jgi:hypothetical protein
VTKLGRFDLNWILPLLLAILAIAPLTYPGFFQAQSGFLPAFNAAHPAQAPNWGGITGSLSGEGKLPYLLIWPFYQLSGSGVVAVRWGYGLAFLLAALGVYVWTRRWLGNKGAVLAATIYTYLPWHLSTVYVRGAYAEAWLWAFLPFALWAVDLLAERRVRSRLTATVVGLSVLAGATWTQPGLTALFVPILAAYGATMVFSRRAWAVSLVPALALLTILLIGLIQAARPTATSLAGHFLYPYQLLSAAWDPGSSAPGQAEGLSFQLGLAAVGLGMVALALKMRAGQAPPDAAAARLASVPLERAFWFWVIVLPVLVLLTLSPSALLWRSGHLQAFVTWPWQVLAFVGLPLAFLAGSVVRLEGRLTELPLWAGLLILVILASYPYLAPRFTQVDPGPEPVAMLQPVGADIPQILILDDQIVPPTEITPTLILTLTWQAIAPVPGDYTIFVHLLSGADTKAAQVDTRPCGGECPTDTWQPGEIVVDRYQLTLAPDASAGPYRLAMGLYLLDTGERAAVAGRDDSTVFLHVP